MVATDGHKAIFDRSIYRVSQSPFKASTYLKTGDLIGPDFELKYPNIKSFYPRLEDYSDSITWHVPKWIEKIPVKGHTKLYLTLDNEILLTTPKYATQWTCLDLKQLKPLANESIKFSFKISRDSEGNFDKVDTLAPVYFLIESGIDGVIMPLRA